ncbi:MAG: DUF5996 family protein [Acidimicrobiia bacterium]|nr:DUF5996 family protein [Acidimicrobiia bacterium]
MHTLPMTAMPADWEKTRATLQRYAHALGAVARVHAVPHPKWWHVSLEVVPTGLVTDAMPIPDRGTFWLRMDLNEHAVLAETSTGDSRRISMRDGLTGSEFGEALLAIVADLGLDGDYAREKFESDEPQDYDPAAAEQFFAALVRIERNLQLHRVGVDGPVGPLQLWPHGFDLAFEWFGEGDAQINLGFYPAGRPYFYSNPSPFDSSLTSHALPAPASWHSDGWEGSILYYDDLLAGDDPAATLLAYAGAVYQLAAPGLRTQRA